MHDAERTVDLLARHASPVLSFSSCWRLVTGQQVDGPPQRRARARRPDRPLAEAVVGQAEDARPTVTMSYSRSGGVGAGVEQVGRQEGHLQEVVPPERVVGVLDVVLAERDRDPGVGQPVDRQVERPGVRVADETEPGGAGTARQRRSYGSG